MLRAIIWQGKPLRELDKVMLVLDTIDEVIYFFLPR